MGGGGSDQRTLRLLSNYRNQDIVPFRFRKLDPGRWRCKERGNPAPGIELSPDFSFEGASFRS